MIQNLPEGFMEALKINTSVVDGEIAYITWESLPWFPLATDTFLIREGKIQYQTFAAYQAGCSDINVVLEPYRINFIPFSD
jgi:hypothetical protein